VQQGAVDGDDGTGLGHLDGAGDDGVLVGDEGIGEAAGDEVSLGCVVAVDEAFRDTVEAGGVGLAEQLGSGQAKDGQGGVVLLDGSHDRGGLDGVLDGAVVEGPVGFDVADAGSGDPAERVQGTDLVEHVVGELVGGHVHAAASEAGEVPVGHLRPDGDALGGGPGGDRAQGGWVAGVEAARDVGAADDPEQGVVVAQAPHPEALPEVAVEVDGGAHVIS
jgi:hypothetical protein